MVSIDIYFWPHLHLRLWFLGKMGSKWLLLKGKMKGKLLMRFSLIFLHGLTRVLGIGELRMEGRWGFRFGYLFLEDFI